MLWCIVPASVDSEPLAVSELVVGPARDGNPERLRTFGRG